VAAKKPDDKLASLLEVSQVLAGATTLRAALVRVLERLERHHGVAQAAVWLVDEEQADLAIEAAIGVSAEGRRTRYARGEGLTGRVLSSGKPVVVPDASKEPLYLNRAFRSAKRRSFVGVPITTGKVTVGALAVGLPFNADRDYNRMALRFLGLVGSMIAQAVRGRTDSSARSDEQRLVEENTHAAARSCKREATTSPTSSARPQPDAPGVRADRPGRAHQLPPCCSAASRAPARS
jgi:Nif-specific regulatory protein